MLSCKISHVFSVVIIIFFAVCTVHADRSGKGCPRRYQLLHDRICFKIGSTPVVWTEANRLCQRDGGSLLKMASIGDFDTLRQIVGTSNGQFKTAFIGVVDRGDGLGFSNLDKSTVFAPFLTNGHTTSSQEMGDTNCAYVNLPEGSGKFGPCGAKRSFICTYVPNDVRSRMSEGKQKRINCHVCHRASTNEECNAKGIQLCPSNAGSCQNEVRVVNGEKTITKRCKQTRACQNNYVQNKRATWLEAQCQPGRRGSSVCRCCCQGNECNSGELPCLAKGCEPLRLPQNGEVSCTDEYRHGSLCTFACDFGFMLSGSDTTRCTGNGQWTSAVPQCKRTTCVPAMASPKNGSVSCSNGNKGASMCHFRCRLGHYLRGLSISTCLGTGNWSVAQPSCDVIECSRPLQEPENGRFLVHKSGGLGQITTFACNDKYFLVGKRSVRCADRNLDGIGEWTAKPPKCRLIRCQAPLIAPEDGQLSLSTTNSEVGTVARFWCNKGYFLRGRAEVACNGPATNGIAKWNGNEPKCVEITCKRVVTPINGEEIRSTSPIPTLGTALDFACKYGYALIGSETSECIDSNNDGEGEWTEPPPICREILCRSSLKPPLNGQIVFDGGNSFSATVTFSCNEGFFLSGQPTAVCVDQDNDGFGEWASDAPSCQPIICSPMMSQPTNGAMVCSASNNYGTSCTFSCDEGFYLSGSATVKCVSPRMDGVGEWSNDEPTCAEILCHRLLQPDNGDTSCSDENHFNSFCLFSCNEGFWLQDIEPSVCLSDNGRAVGRWSKPTPQCSEITCDGSQIQPEFGFVTCTKERKYGSVCRYSCMQGYNMEGANKSACKDDDNDGEGNWDNAPPACKRIRCQPEAASPVNGTVECNDSNFYASTCLYRCSYGYSLIGEQKKICEDSAWSALEPTCERMICQPVLHSLDNGIIICSEGNYVGSICQSFCDLGYNLIGQSETRCVADGSNTNASFTSPAPRCKGIYCDKIDGPVKGGNIVCGVGQGEAESNRYGTSCYLTCDDGWRLQGNTRTTCLGFGDWDATLGWCEMIVCQPPLHKPPRGDISCSNDKNVPGTTCTFTCKTGMMVDNGVTVVTCSEEGQWIGEQPVCVSAA